MIDARRVCLFVPPGLRKFKLLLFERIGSHIRQAGGLVVRDSFDELERVAASHIPIVGCTPQLRPMIDRWQAERRTWIYWDRGYARRVFATDLPRGAAGGFYRWHVNNYQMTTIRLVPDDRWRALELEAWRWQPGGRHIVVAKPSPTYERFHGIEGWAERTVAALRGLTDRRLVLRDKEDQASGRRLLRDDLAGAHCLVTHGSIAAVESVIMGCPVFVDRSSAAALVGLTDLAQIEAPIYPDRSAWLAALAYSQFNEAELVDGTLFRMLQ